MTDIDLINIELSCESYFVWNPTDILKLRDQRLLGTLIGSAPKLDNSHRKSVPLILQEETARLAVELGIAQVIRLKSEKLLPSIEQKESQESVRAAQLQEQCRFVNVSKSLPSAYELAKGKAIKRKSKQEIGDTATAKQIKKCAKKFRTTEPSELDICEANKELEEQAHKQSLLEPDELLVHCCASSTRHTACDYDVIAFPSIPSSTKQEVKYKIYKELRSKHFYLTSGLKFGCDYLAYPGIKLLIPVY